MARSWSRRGGWTPTAEEYREFFAKSGQKLDKVITAAYERRDAMRAASQVGIPEHWDEKFMNLARHIATWSKDRSRKVGCVIVGESLQVVALGYNGFPRAVNDDVEERHQRPLKYKWTEHSERNAVFNAARTGVSTLGCVLYLPWYPCADCARAIIQAGIVELVAIEPDWADATFAQDFDVARTLFKEAGVQVRFMAGDAPKQREVIAAGGAGGISIYGGTGGTVPATADLGGPEVHHGQVMVHYPSSLVDDSPGARLGADAQALKDQDEAVEPTDFTSRR